MTWTLFTEDVSNEQVVETFEDVERAAQRAIRYTSGFPSLVTLSLDHQSVMAIVVGAQWSTAFFQDNINGLKLYAAQPGMVPKEGAKPLLYVTGGSQSELDLENAIPVTEAWEGLRYYFETRLRPETIHWAGYMRVDRHHDGKE